MARSANRIPCRHVALIQMFAEKGKRGLKNYNLQKLNVLLIEKNDFMRGIMREILRAFFIRNVQDAETPDAGYAIFRVFPADLILADWVPGLDGLKFLKKARNGMDSPNPFVPVIVVTANTELHHVYAALDAGMHDFLAKPISATLIYSRICRVIERERDFIRTRSFFGPDRRRRQNAPLGPKSRMGPNKGDSARRRTDHMAGQYWTDRSLTEDDVQRLLIG